MKRFIQILLLALVLTQISSAQWFWQHDGYILRSVYFIDSDTGWAVGFQEILKTTDGGNSWMNQYAGTYIDLHSVYFINSDTGWAVGYEIILKTTNGGDDWELKYSETCIFESVYFIDSDTGWAVGKGIPKILKTTDGGDNWENCECPFVDYLSVFFIDSNIGWVVTQQGIILKTTNGGNNWESQESGTYTVLNSVHFTDPDNGWIVGNNGKMIKTTDGGLLWQPQSTITGYNLYSVYFTDLNTGWAVGNGGIILHTTDGNIWTVQSSGTQNSLYSVYFIDSNIGWTAGTGVILHTTNGGIPVELISFSAQAENQKVILNWTTATETNNRGFQIQRSSGSDDFVTIGFVEGNGTTTEMHNYSYVDNDISFGSYSYRLKQYDYDGSFNYSEVVKVEFDIPSQFVLEQNYPNPFNPSTAIRFSLPEPANVTLTIYNILGQKVSELVNSKLETGNYNYQWDAANSSTGIYIYELRTERSVLVKKMLLLK